MSSVSNNITDDKKPRKKTVPKVVRDLSWNKWVGEDVAKTKCFCCGVNEIRMNSFHCGHVVAEANGGKTTVDNLRPICAACNLSMGTEDLEEFKKKCGFGLTNESQSITTQPISNPDESDEPVEWYAGILEKRFPKFLTRPVGKPFNFMGQVTYPLDSSVFYKMERELKANYTQQKNGIWQRNSSIEELAVPWYPGLLLNSSPKYVKWQIGTNSLDMMREMESCRLRFLGNYKQVGDIYVRQ